MGGLWDGFLGGVVGSAIGVLSTTLYERHQRRSEIAVGLIQQYNSNFDAIGKALKLLCKARDANYESDLDLNPVRKIGDWYETVAALCVENVARGKLLAKVGIVGEMNRFYIAASDVPRLNDVVKLWPYMKQFCKG